MPLDYHALLLEAIGHISELVDDTDHCTLDHHGYCQEHYLEKPCRVQVAKDWLAVTMKGLEP